MDITIISSIHTKSLDKNPNISKAIKDADLIIEEGVSDGNKFESFKTEPLILLYWEIFSKLPFFKDIKSSRKIASNADRINVDSNFTELVKLFYRWYHGLIEIILIFLIVIGLISLPYFIIGIEKLNFYMSSFAFFVAFLFIFLPTSTFFLYFLNKMAGYRNDLVVTKIKTIDTKNKNIVIIYGAGHSKDLYNKLKAIENCKVKIIKSRICPLLHRFS